MEQCKTCKHYRDDGLYGFCTHFHTSHCVIRIIECEAYEPKNHSAGDSKKVSDNVNSPSHYTQGGIECIDALKAATAGLTGIEAVCTVNAIKYLWRWKHKNGIEDIDKAIWYLNRLRKEVQGNGS
jgi:hypothetical protein